VPFEGLVSVDSKDGMNELKQDYNFIISIQPDGNMILKRKESHPATEATLIEKTSKYITAQISETGYFFFDIERELVYTIDRFKERHISMGYADDLEKVKETTQKINQWQQDGKKPEEILTNLKQSLNND